MAFSSGGKDFKKMPPRRVARGGLWGQMESLS
jgi:hypothetical protein